MRSDQCCGLLTFWAARNLLAGFKIKRVRGAEYVQSKIKAYT